MSVIGIDFGNESCYVAVARSGGIETVDNDYSLRATSSCVAFGERQRILGVPAKNQLVTNIKNTVFGFKRLLGRQFDEPWAQEEMRRFPFSVCQHPDTRGIGVKVRYLGEEHVFAVEQLAAMLLTKLKETTEAALQTKIGDCVISVPSYYTDCERRALQAAATMAGLHCLRLMNDTTATALSYGIYKQDLPEADDPPRNVVFVDCGHSALQVWATAFNKGKLKVLASASDPHLGGRDFDRVLASHFIVEFREKYKIDVSTNARAYVRLLTEVEKLKKQMSANATKLPLNIECLMDDKDVTSSMCRADFEKMCADLFKRVETTMQTLLHDSKLQPNEIYSVEVVGGSTRIPAIKQLIEKTFGKAPSTTLNQDEAVARGCALQCAILSPAYKVRDFKITDAQPYPIRLIWDETQGEDGGVDVFPQYHPIPYSRAMTFYKRETFPLTVAYKGPVPYPSQEIAKFLVRIPAAPPGDTVKVKVKTRITMDGIFNLCSATAYEKLELGNGEDAMDVESSQTDGPTENVEDGEMNGPTSQPAEMSTDQQENSEQQPEGKEEQKKKIKYKEIPVEVDASFFGLSNVCVASMTESEGKMIADDRKEKERVDAKNALEEFVYLLRDKLDGELSNFVEERDKTRLSSDLSDLENWLYEDGSDEQRQVYADKLGHLKTQTAPIFERFREYKARPDALREFEVAVQLARKVVDMNAANEARYDHLDATDIQKLQAAIKDGENSVRHTREILFSVQPHMDSPITSADIIQQRKAFESVVHPITNKPKPKPPSPKKEEVEVPATEEEMPAEGEGKKNDPNQNNTPNHNNEQGTQEMELE